VKAIKEGGGAKPEKRGSPLGKPLAPAGRVEKDLGDEISPTKKGENDIWNPDRRSSKVTLLKLRSGEATSRCLEGETSLNQDRIGGRGLA